MEFTGERPTLEREMEGSRARYHSVLPFCENKSVLDIGCGIGHGSFLIASHNNRSVVGYDTSAEAIQEAEKLFQRSNLFFVCDKENLQSYIIGHDLICMIESIEHFEHAEAIELIRSISGCGKEFVGTTPNGVLFPYHPQGPGEYRGFHKWHFTIDELNTILAELFQFVEIYGHMYDPKIQQFTSYTFFGSNRTVL